MKTRFAKLLFVWLLGVSFVIADDVTQQGWDQADDNDLRLLEVTVDRYVMDEILTAYQFQDRIMVPLGLFCEILGFAIEVDPGSKTAEGFILNEERHFFLDVQRGQVTISGKQSSLDPGGVRVDANDIYIDSEYLSSWFPLRLNIDLFISEAKIYPKEPLPLQQRLDRERRIEKTRRWLMLDDAGFQHYRQPYVLWSAPSIDQNIQLGWRQDAANNEIKEIRYATYAAADLLYMESSWYLAGSDEDIVEESRIKFGRMDPDAGLLGPLKATEYGIGHIERGTVDLVTANSLPMLGVMLSNNSLHQQNQFDKHTFRGELPPGWEVELYHNNSLLDYQQVGSNGQYSFVDVPLLYGNNYFRLVFYGPQGQRLEEQKNFALNETLMRKGESRYQLSASQDDNHDSHTVVKYSYGVLKALSAELALTSLPIDKVEHQYQSFGLKGFGMGAFYGLNITNDNMGGNVSELFLQSRIGPFNLGLSDIRLDQFVSEDLPLFGDPLKHRSELRLDAAIPAFFLPRIPVTIEVDRNEFSSGVTENTIRNRVTTHKSGVAVGNDLVWNVRSGRDTTLNGNLMLSQFMSGSSIRGDVIYTVKPEADLRTASFSFNSQYFLPYSLKLHASHSFTDNANQYSAELSKRVDGYLLSLAAGYNTSGDIDLKLSWSMNFGREPRTPYWMNSVRPLASRGAISARAFLDKDRDGVYGLADRPLKDVGFIVGNGYTADPARTDINGVAFVTSVPTNQPLAFRIAEDSLEDPLWSPAVEGMQIVARPGQVVQLDFPVLEMGEIDGTIYAEHDEDQTRGIRGVTVEIINQQGQVIKSVRSAFDGYYVISDIPMGQYQVRIVPKSGQRYDPQSLKPVTVELGSEQLYLYDLDFVLKPQP